MSRKIKGILLTLSPKNPTAEVIEIEDTLEEFYRILDCDCIDVTVREVLRGKSFDIVCDDNGAIIDNPILSAINTEFSTGLFGNLFVCNSSGGEFESLSPEDIVCIKESIVMRATDEAVLPCLILN